MPRLAAAALALILTAAVAVAQQPAPVPTPAEPAPAPPAEPSTAAPAAPEPPAAAPAPRTEIGAWRATPLADAALVAALAAAAGAAKPGPFTLRAAPFQAGDRSWIVPVQVATTQAPAAPQTGLVGRVLSGGEPRFAFRLDQAWQKAGDQHYVQETLLLPPGSYELEIGLADATGAVAWAARQPVTVPAPSEDFWISELVLSDAVFPMTTAQDMLQPWAWQGVAVVPRGDDTFPQGAGLWYYLHACNTGVGAEGKPDLGIVVELSGTKKFRGPAQTEPVAMNPACWTIAQGIDLLPDVFPPGDYKLAVQVTDRAAGKTLTASRAFKVTAAPAPAPSP